MRRMEEARQPGGEEQLGLEGEEVAPTRGCTEQWVQLEWMCLISV